MNHPLQRLSLQFPIFQAPIGGVASPELAAAVSNAGGLGHLSCTWRSRENLRHLSLTMSKLTDRPWGANFVLDFPIEDKLCAALDGGVRAISFFWGDGARYVQQVQRAGAVALQIVGTLSEARRAADAGFDLIVAQGRDAGGHVRGELGTMSLVPQVVDAVDPIPVLASGGIVDQRGVAAALALGASGVWIGTRFLTSHEANIHPEYQARVLAANGDDTVHSTLFDIGWKNAPMSTLRNSTFAEWEKAGMPTSPDRPNEGEIVGRRLDGSAIPRYGFSAPMRETQGDIQAMALYAGGAVGLANTRQSARDIFRDLARGFTCCAALANSESQ